MLDSLITSKTRIKLLSRLFLNINSEGYLRGLETEFGESSNAIRLELNRFEHAGLLTSHAQGNKKVYAANTLHPLFPDINSLLRKHLGIDQLVEQIVERLGEVEEVYLTGAFACGKQNADIEMLFVGGNVNAEYLDVLIDKTQKLLKREIKYSMLTPAEFLTLAAGLGKDQMLLLWKRNF